MRKPVSEVANIIFEEVNNFFRDRQESSIWTSDDYPSTNHAIRFDKQKLRDISGRKAIRKGFGDQIKKCLDGCEYETKVDDNGIVVTPMPEEINIENPN